jgi:hypothetical protein
MKSSCLAGSVRDQSPLRLRLNNERIELSRLRGPFRMSQIGVEHAEAIVTTASRYLTIENETTLHEIAKLGGGELLVHTSYPGLGTLALLQR